MCMGRDAELYMVSQFALHLAAELSFAIVMYLLAIR